jgi:hypothetical protein
MSEQHNDGTPYADNGPGLDHSGHTVVRGGQAEAEPIVYEDYWGTNETIRHTMPDGVSWFEIKKMNEGDRARYQYEAQLKMTTKRKTGDTEIDLDHAKDRMALICNSVIGWNLRRDGQPVLFNMQALRAWVTATSPVYVDALIGKIRKFNPFLQEDLSSEDLREQIKDLQEMLDLAIKREAEADFS